MALTMNTISLDDSAPASTTSSVDTIVVENILNSADKIEKETGVATEEDRVKMAKDFYGFLKGLVTEGKPSPEAIEREKESLRQRRLNAQRRKNANLFLAAAGVQGANQNLVADAEVESTIDYLLSKIEDNPKGYAMARMAEIVKDLGQTAQGFAGIIANATHGYSESANAAANLMNVRGSNIARASELRSGVFGTATSEPKIDSRNYATLVQSYMQLQSDKKMKKTPQGQALSKSLEDILGINVASGSEGSRKAY